MKRMIATLALMCGVAHAQGPTQVKLIGPFELLMRATEASYVDWGGVTNKPTVWPGTATDLVARASAAAAAGTADWGGVSNRPAVWPGVATDSVARVDVAVLTTNTPTLAQFVAATNATRMAQEDATTAYQHATNAQAMAAGWLTSVAYGITAGMTNWWMQGYVAGTNWLASVASGITVSDTNNWTTAFGWGNHAGLYDAAGTAAAATQAIDSAFIAAAGGVTNGATVMNALQLGGLAAASYTTNALQAWGFVDPAPTSAVQNIQWTPYFASTGTVRGVRGKTLSGTVVADIIKQNWTNAAASYTTVQTGVVFGVIATNVPFVSAITAGDLWGVVSTNVTSATNWWVSLEWTP